MILMNTLYYIYIHMNIFRIGLKIIEETEYELKEISIHWFQKSIIIFQIWLSIFDTLSNLFYTLLQLKLLFSECLICIESLCVWFNQTRGFNQKFYA